MRITTKMRRSEAGIALVTTILLMLLMSSLIVGFLMLVTQGQRLSGINSDNSKAFYGAEAGMEKITADLGTLFSKTYSPSAAQLTAIESAPPVLTDVIYQKFDGTSGYSLDYPVDGLGNPLATVSQISSGTSPYQGMTALITPYTLTVTARTPQGTEVKLQRTTQTVGIPMFQFGVFCDGDCSFFPGPNFNFGGRTHTNGNLFLATGSTLSLSDRVTAVKDVIRTNLSNGYPTSTSYAGTVNITTAPGSGSYRALAQTEGSLLGNLGTAINPVWYNLSTSASNYAGNIKNGKTGAQQLNLGITTLGTNTKPIDIIRRPTALDDPTVLQQRYFAQASVRVLLSDNPVDITSLPCVSGGAPLDLSLLATDPATWAGSANPAVQNLFTRMTNNNAAGLNTRPVPLATSGAAVGAAAYATSQIAGGNGYWVPNPGPTVGFGLPIIKGFIKIDVQLAPYGNPCGGWRDVTTEVLSYGYVGKNLNPYYAGSLNNPSLDLTAAQYGPTQPLMTLNLSGQLPPNPNACPDLHPNAIIRLERVRDNPSNWKQGLLPSVPCGVVLNANPVNQVYPKLGSDYWPNALFDTREGTIRDENPPGSLGVMPYAKMVTLGGVMNYVEVDTANLARYLTGALAGSGTLSFDAVTAPNDYVLYVSDRRGNYKSQVLPAGTVPLSPSTFETGEYGFEDFINLTDPSNGCPNSTLDTGEDLDGIGTAAFFTYGQDATKASQMYNAASPAISGNGYFPNNQVGAPAVAAVKAALVGATVNNAVAANYVCPAVALPTAVWPQTMVIHANEARENPNFFFRRAVKLVNSRTLGNLMNICPGNVRCGLTIASENPIYVQGDFNANSAGGGFGDAYVATSIIGDAVTLLSNNWNDVNSFYSTFNQAQRGAATSFYHTAIVGGKGISFPQPSGEPQDFGTDGGVHNFLRFLEAWGSNTLNYRGSMISLYTSRQAISTFKCCATVYGAPVRAYAFDTDFLTPQLLPPRTPLFRSVNTTGFTQLLLSTQQN